VERGEKRDVRAFVELLNASRPQHAVNIEADLPENAFFQRGDFWVVAYDGKTVYLRDSVGLSYIARILAEPNRDIPAVSLLAARIGIDPRVASGSSGTVLTDETRKNYMRRYQELQDDLQVAIDQNDIGRIEKLECEMGQLASELATATGLGGRAREKSDIEKVRKSVSMAVSRAIGTIGKRHESLGRHLTVSITSGLTFRYAPEREVEWMV
jgi:non-specific serine/threonine protein kinase